jgi:hypothetical protein
MNSNRGISGEDQYIYIRKKYWGFKILQLSSRTSEHQEDSEGFGAIQ